MIKILIVHGYTENSDRKVIDDNLFSFRKYNPYKKTIIIDYVNIFNNIDYNNYIDKYDVIIYHWQILAHRYSPEQHWNDIVDKLSRFNGYKVIIPQDEYDFTERIWKFCRLNNVQTIFSCAYDSDTILTAYPPNVTGIKNYYKVLTGYVDDDTLKKLNLKMLPFDERPIDIGYRARKWIDRYGQCGNNKYLIGEKFFNILQSYTLKSDIIISNEFKDSFYGENWFNFILKCKACLGSESGSDLFDPYGKLHNVRKLPLNEVQQLKGRAISPRIFDYAVCKTLQICVEGKYDNILIPWKHYIPIKSDFSNIHDVIKIVQFDTKLCNTIIENAYNDLVLSGEYGYKKYVKFVLDMIKYDLKCK